MMPKNLYLVRHGESEGNVANSRSRQGDHSAFSTDFLLRSSREWRLTSRGIEQAKSAGKWFEQNVTEPFGRNYVSAYHRAMETAGYIDRESLWIPEIDLRERDRGYIDVKSQEQLQKEYEEVLKQRTIDSLLWCPPGGESLAQMKSGRMRSAVLETLARECSQMSVRIVCHGEVMWVLRMLLEKMPLPKFYRLDVSKRAKDKIHNCQIIHYTRINPRNGHTETYYNYMRSICPWDTALSSNKWTKIPRRKYLGSELLEQVEKTPRLVC